MAYQEKRVRRSREIPKHCWTRLMIYIKLERRNFFFWTLLQLLYCKGSSPNLWDWKTVLLQMTCEQYNLPFGSIENYHMLFLYFIMLLKTPALKLIRKKILAILPQEDKEYTVMKIQKNWETVILLHSANHQWMPVISVFNQPYLSCHRYILSLVCSYTHYLCACIYL